MTPLPPPHRLPELAAALVALLMAGCGTATPAPFQPGDLDPYAELKRTKETQHARLRDEIYRIEVSGGLPTQLDPAKPSQADLGRELLAVLAPQDHQRMASEIARVWPAGRFTMSPQVRQQTVELLCRHRDLQASLRALLAAPGKSFRFPFRQGLAGETSFIAAARIAGRLEGLAAAETLLTRDAPQVADAIASLDRMLEWSARLGAVPHTLPRLAAADLRTDAIPILAAIAQHPLATDADLVRLHSLAQRELARWPADSEAWVGERAVALHSYEMIRDGHLLSFLSIDEIALARKQGSIHALGESVQANLAHDEFFYLTELQQVISISRQPFYERAASLRELERKLRSLESTPEYPYVAAKLLLPAISQGHRRQAEDLARWTQWAIALAAGTGQSSAAATIDPLTGESFSITREETRVVVRRPGRGGEGSPAAIVPIVRNRASEATARRQ